MSNLRSCPLLIIMLIFSAFKLSFAIAKGHFCLENDEELSPSSSLKIKLQLSKLSLNLPDIQFDKKREKRSVSRMVYPSLLTQKNKRPKHRQHIPKDLTSKFSIKDGGNFSNNFTSSYVFLTKPLTYIKQFSKLGLIAANEVKGDFCNHHFCLSQIMAAVRQKYILHTRPMNMTPHVEHKMHLNKIKTFQSKTQQKNINFEEEANHEKIILFRKNISPHQRHRRDTNSKLNSSQLMDGGLLPVALTILGENGEILTGRALLQHITVLLKNASTFRSKDAQDENEFNQFVSRDVLLNEKQFNQIMDNSMNLTDPVMLTVLGVSALNDSSLLTNTFVNEYLNCIDSSKISHQIKGLQNKIDCMKQKMFDRNNFATSDLSRYSITNLPASLVYADVMRNIQNLVRSKNGIAFYSLPVDEPTQVQKVVVPVEEYASPRIHSSQQRYTSRSNHNWKIFLNENIQPRMPIWYLVKPDGRIYQTESRNFHPTIVEGFPDIPNDDVFIDEAEAPFYEPVFYDL